MQAAVIDLERLRLAVPGRRIPHAAAVSLLDAAALSGAAQRLRAQAEIDAEQLRAQARAQGYTEGRGEALSEAQRLLLDAQMAARGHLQQDEARVAALALAVVARIAPRLGTSTVVPALIEEALSALQAERYVVIRVHPEVEAAVTAELGRWRSLQPMAASVQIATDSRLEPFGLVIESEAGRLCAGLPEQLSALEARLRQSSATTANEGVA
jgi:flagellar biosynthesis/type III secretory pathway protein FliH